MASTGSGGGTKGPGLKSLQAPDASDADALALTVLSAVLDGYTGARLNRRHFIGGAAGYAEEVGLGICQVNLLGVEIVLSQSQAGF